MLSGQKWFIRRRHLYFSLIYETQPIFRNYSIRMRVHTYIDPLHENLNFFGLRRMFYLVLPQETAFESIEKTPNYADEVISYQILKFEHKKDFLCNKFDSNRFYTWNVCCYWLFSSYKLTESIFRLLYGILRLFWSNCATISYFMVVSLFSIPSTIQFVRLQVDFCIWQLGNNVNHIFSRCLIILSVI